MSSLHSTPLGIGGLGIGIGIGSLTVACVWLSYQWIRYRVGEGSTTLMPDFSSVWHHVGSIASIDMYPLKSCGALELNEAECREEHGLYFGGLCDRRLVLMHVESGRLASSGRYPKMLAIKGEVIGDQMMRLQAPGEQAIVLDVSQIRTKEVREKQMKGYSLPLIECQPEHHAWCSRVVLQQEHGMRLYLALDPIVEMKWGRAQETGLVPIMAIHSKSLDVLNSQLEPHNRPHHHQFRGNLLIHSRDQVKAFYEDNWQWLRIGDDSNAADCVILRYKAPCLRCIIPNINVVTCERNADFEPLRTLKKFRLRSHPKEPEMGIYFDVVKSGVVRKNAPVYVQYK